MKKKLIIGVAVLVLLALVAMRLLKPQEKEVAASVPVVTTQNPATDSIYLKTGLTGSIEPADIVYVIPKAAGEITEVSVKAGDMVEEGQKLVHIDTKMVDSARIALDTAAVSVSDANKNLQRMQVLAAGGDISQQQLESAQSAAKMAQLQYDSAKLNYNNQIEFSDVTAPISGKVESVNVEVHDNVSQQNMICVISGEGSKSVSFSVTERIVGNLNVGDRIELEKNGSDYTGVITEISSMVDAATGLFKVKASVDNANALATGAQVKLYVTSEQTENAMVIPTKAVSYAGGQAYVYTLDGEMVHEVPVTVGIYDSEKTEILEGISKNDEVIITWTSELFEGAKAQKKEA